MSWATANVNVVMSIMSSSKLLTLKESEAQETIDLQYLVLFFEATNDLKGNQMSSGLLHYE